MPAFGVVTDRGLRALLGNALAPRMFVRLYVDDAEVTTGAELGDFQAAAFPGYADLEVTTLWTGVISDTVGRATSRLFNLSWTRGAGLGVETVYGWLLYQLPAPDSFLLDGGRLTAPEIVSAAGDVVLLSILSYLLRG